MEGRSSLSSLRTAPSLSTATSFDELQLHLEYFNGFLSPYDDNTEGVVSNKPVDISLLTSLGEKKMEQIHQLFLTVFQFIEDTRYLAADDVFNQIKTQFAYPLQPPSTTNPSSTTTAAVSTATTTSTTTAKLEHDQQFLNQPQLQQFLAYKQYDKMKLYQFLERVKEVQDTIDYQDDSGEGWILGAELFGVKTYYRIDESDGSLIMKLIGSQGELPIFELCSVFKEVDLFYEWIPFCKESAIVDKVGKAEVIPYVWLSSPFLGRDFAFQAYAADIMIEHEQILIMGKSVGDYSPKPVPYKKSGWFQNKMVMKELKSIVNIKSPNSAQNTMILHVDVNSSLPQALLNFIMKNIAGMLLYLFSRQAIKASKDPNSSHAKRIREDKEFYRDWLLPKIRVFCDHKGWEQPTINSLGADGIPPPKALSPNGTASPSPSLSRKESTGGDASNSPRPSLRKKKWFSR